MIRKRGTSNRGIGLDLGAIHSDLTPQPPRQQRSKNGTWIKLIVALVMTVAIIVGGGYYYIQYKDEQERQRLEDLIWKARYELSIVESDKTISYLRLNNTKYEDGMLKLELLMHTSHDIIKAVGSDSTAHSKMFFSLVSLYPECWATVSQCLEEANTDMELTYIDRGRDYKQNVTHSMLKTYLADENIMGNCTKIFAQLKAAEIYDYACQHFRGDKYLTPDSVSLTDDFVTLYISFDDSKYYLDDSYLDSTRVDVQFTDKVGDMGSVYDGMISLCSRTDRGFAFVYQGSKRNTIHRVPWSRERTRVLCENYKGLIGQQDRKTHQVRTIVTKKTKQN